MSWEEAALRGFVAGAFMVLAIVLLIVYMSENASKGNPS